MKLRGWVAVSLLGFLLLPGFVSAQVVEFTEEEEETGACYYLDTKDANKNYCKTEFIQTECTKLCLGREGVTRCLFAKGAKDCAQFEVSTSSAGVAKKKPVEIPVIQIENPLHIGSVNVQVILGKVLDPVIGVVGALALGVFVYGGYMWLTSAGNEEKVKKGTQAIIYAVVGLFLIFAAYGILSLVIRSVTGAGGP